MSVINTIGPPLTPLIATPSIRYDFPAFCIALMHPEKKQRVCGAMDGKPNHPTSLPMLSVFLCGISGIRTEHRT